MIKNVHKVIVKVFRGGNPEDNNKAVAEIRRVQVVEVVIVNTPFMDDYVLTPYLELGDGTRYFGINAISGYVSKKVHKQEAQLRRIA